MGQPRARQIGSPTNSLLKVYRRALAKGTTREEWLAVEGPFLVEEALAAAPAVRTHSAVISESGWARFARLMERLPAEAEAVQVPDRLFEQVAQTQNPQGIAALVEQGINDSLTPVELGDAIMAWSGFDEYRSEMIARTELMDAYNAAALGSYFTTPKSVHADEPSSFSTAKPGTEVRKVSSWAGHGPDRLNPDQRDSCETPLFSPNPENRVCHL
jgi:hypothetical protein